MRELFSSGVSRALFLTLAMMLMSGGATAGELKPFTSDGCSAFPDGTLQQNRLWLECCVAHDRAYWKGGTYAERKEADEALHHCVAAVGEPQIAALMLAGVRVGGSPFWPTRFRWGYGWPYPRFYGSLSIEELAEIAAMEALEAPVSEESRQALGNGVTEAKRQKLKEH